jgi:hypothetical protein
LLVIWHSCICRRKGGVDAATVDAATEELVDVTVIRGMVQQEVRSAIQSLLGRVSTAPRAKNGRRRRRRRRGPGRPRGSKNKAA